MKRIEAACITQTILFTNVEGKGKEYAERKLQEEIARYKKRLDKERIKYKVISEEIQEDGSILMEIVREYNNKSVGNYLD